MIPLVAVPVMSPSARLSGKILTHLTKADNLDTIETSNDGEISQVHLEAGQGWSFSGRFARDYSVLDPFLHKHKAYGCYTYFFMGETSWWARLKNIGWSAMWGDLSGLATIEVTGEDLMKSAELLFYRLDDNVVVIRGDYIGPARIIRH